MKTRFQSRRTIATLDQLRNCQPGQFINFDGSLGRYMGSTSRTDYVLWRNTGSNRFSSIFAKLASH